MNIHEFLDLPHRFRWGGIGGDDCTTFCATWIQNVTGIDPANELRGTYRTQEGAHEVLNRFGGLSSFMAHHLEHMGFKRVQNPIDGDVGIIKSFTPGGHLGVQTTLLSAIRFGPLWATLSPHGVARKKADFISAWRVS